MRPIFTVHAGEYLTACHIEAKFRDLRVWVPSKDDGIDLLVTNKKRSKSLALQVKFSKDFLSMNSDPIIRTNIKAFGWWTIDLKKIESSAADYWVFVLPSFSEKKNSYIIIRPTDLLRKYRNIHGSDRRLHSYLWVTPRGQCWETRGLNAAEKMKVAEGTFHCPERNFSSFLNNWNPIKQIQ